MEVYRVSLIGHRMVEHHREIEERLGELLFQLLHGRAFVEFQIGRNGDFDILAAACIKQAQKKHGCQNSAVTLALPYAVSDMAYYENYYDRIVIPTAAERAHPKHAIEIRNRWLAENADLLIAYVRRDTGGAAACLKIAERAGVKIVKI